MRTATWGWLIAVGGVLLLGSAAVHVVTSPTKPSLHRAVDLVLIGGSGAALLYGGYWHATRSLLVRQYHRVLGGTLLIALLFVGVGVVALYIGSRRVEPAELFEAAWLAASVGVAAGLFFGTTHARAVEGAETAARAEARAAAIEAERERAERLNDLLRHYVLNGVNVISGHVDRLRPAVPDDDQPSLDSVDRRARSMVTLVEHADSLLTSEREPPSSTTVDLVAAVESVAAGRNRTPTVRVRTPDSPLPVVVAAGTLDHVLDLLFDGVETVTGGDGEVTVACEGDSTAATVTVTATPVDLPDPVADSLFEPVTDVGLEFYLSRCLLDDYGDLRLADGAPGTLRIELRVEQVA